MSYISFKFFAFLAIGVFAYFCTPRKARPYTLLVLNIIFYAFSDLKYLACLFGVIILTYAVGLLLERIKRGRGLVLICYLILTAGGLLFVKFANYGLRLFSKVTGGSLITLDVIVPLGVAFFTLQAIGYAVDIYRGKYPTEKNPLLFALFMSYFPIIVQGPISRYNDLAPQLSTGHKFDYKRFKFGMQLCIWGLFKKLVIANRAALFADTIFNDYPSYSGLMIVAAILLYTLQIYADFSGCVDLCRGVSQMFGIELINNFNHPYFSTSIKDFWRRWHISLSSWLRDYVYIPLGGNRKGAFRKQVNLALTFFVSGLWHGVGIHYIVWGIYHAGCQIIGDFTQKPKARLCERFNVNTKAFSFRLSKQIITFVLVAYSWLLFRANGLVAAWLMTKSIFTSFFCVEKVRSYFFESPEFAILIISTVVLFAVSLMQNKFRIREKLSEQNLWFRWAIYLLAIFSVIIFGVYGEGYNSSEFLYMQF